MPLPAGPRDEATARFLFQAATGVGSLCTVAALMFGWQQNAWGGGVFLVLALFSLPVIAWAGRVYTRLRSQRWTREIAQPERALEQLFAQARADTAAHGHDEERDGA